jgi:protein-S-isoprenylcysteine O-methyltransferase Ste14
MLQASGLIHMGGSAAAPTASSIRLPGGATIDATLMAEARTGDGFLWPGTKQSIAVLVAAIAAALVVWMRRRARAAAMRGARHQSPAGRTTAPKG